MPGGGPITPALAGSGVAVFEELVRVQRTLYEVQEEYFTYRVQAEKTILELQADVEALRQSATAERKQAAAREEDLLARLAEREVPAPPVLQDGLAEAAVAGPSTRDEPVRPKAIDEPTDHPASPSTRAPSPIRPRHDPQLLVAAHRRLAEIMAEEMVLEACLKTFNAWHVARWASRCEEAVAQLMQAREEAGRLKAKAGSRRPIVRGSPLAVAVATAPAGPEGGEAPEAGRQGRAGGDDRPAPQAAPVRGPAADNLPDDLAGLRTEVLALLAKHGDHKERARRFRAKFVAASEGHLNRQLLFLCLLTWAEVVRQARVVRQAAGLPMVKVDRYLADYYAAQGYDSLLRWADWASSHWWMHLCRASLLRAVTAWLAVAAAARAARLVDRAELGRERATEQAAWVLQKGAARVLLATALLSWNAALCLARGARRVEQLAEELEQARALGEERVLRVRGHATDYLLSRGFEKPLLVRCVAAWHQALIRSRYSDKVDVFADVLQEQKTASQAIVDKQTDHAAAVLLTRGWERPVMLRSFTAWAQWLARARLMAKMELLKEDVALQMEQLRRAARAHASEVADHALTLVEHAGVPFVVRCHFDMWWLAATLLRERVWAEALFGAHPAEVLTDLTELAAVRRQLVYQGQGHQPARVHIEESWAVRRVPLQDLSSEAFPPLPGSAPPFPAAVAQLLDRFSHEHDPVAVDPISTLEAMGPPRAYPEKAYITRARARGRDSGRGDHLGGRSTIGARTHLEAQMHELDGLLHSMEQRRRLV